MICCAVCITYFACRAGRPRFNVLLHMLISIGRILVLILPLYPQYLDLSRLFGGQPLMLSVSYPFSWADWGGLVRIGAGMPGGWLARTRAWALTEAAAHSAATWTMTQPIPCRDTQPSGAQQET
jgi:hypothetical protein